MMTVRKTLAAILGSAATAAALITFTGGNEGKENMPYKDPGGVWTVCHGQTGVSMRYYTDAECDGMFADSLVGFAGKVRDMTSGFDTLPDHVKVSTIDFAYNVGLGNYQSSTLRQMLVAKQLPQACEQFLRWRLMKLNGKNIDCSEPQYAKTCGGLWTRRRAEFDMCMGRTK